MNYQREQERIKIWKIKQKAERKRRREWKNLYKAALAHVVIAIMLIALYSLVFISSTKADTIKVGDGPFVLAVSYSDSYKDLTYVSNFTSCPLAIDFYNQNCATKGAMIAMCQLEDKLYMPLNHNPENEFSTFDFEVSDVQSCGFVGVDTFKSTFTGTE
jgi:hypothetical protein